MLVILSKSKIRQARDSAQAAFPTFSNWEYSNETDDMHCGFSIWGEFVPDSDEPKRHFFVTFDTFKETWKGYLTIGQHAYLWSSADFGDAYLLDTEPSATLDDAINALKKAMGDLFDQLLGGMRHVHK